MMFSLALTVLSTITGADAPSQRLPAAEIEQAVQRGIAQRLQAAGSSAQARVVGRLDDQVLPSGKPRIALGQITGRWPRARVGLPVRLLVDERTVRTMTVWVELRDERTVLTYAAAYPAHKPGDELHMVPALVDMSCCAGEVVASADELANARIKRTVRAGQPAMRSDMEPMPDVLAQQRVDIEVARGLVRVMTAGVALNDGRIGGLVSVRPDQSRNAIASRVIAKQKVVVDE